MLYRAYLMENGHTYAAIDVTCVDDDDAKQQMANLSNGRNVEVWQGDRKVGFEIAKESFAKNLFEGNAALVANVMFGAEKSVCGGLP
jgi:hypothetical protein